MVESKSLKLGEILLEKGVINHDQIMEILSIQKESGQKFGEIVVDRGYASDEEVAESLAQIYRLPFIKLSELEIPADVYAVVHVDMLKKFHVVPIRKDEDTLTLATNDPLNVTALQEVQYSTGLQVHPALASLRDIKEKLAGLASPTTTTAPCSTATTSGWTRNRCSCRRNCGSGWRRTCWPPAPELGRPAT